jgi:hypothetical protein
MKALLKHRTGEKGITHYSLSLQQMFSFFPEHLLIARDAAKFAPISMPVADSFGQRGCRCKFGTEGGASTPQYSSPPKGQRTEEPLWRTTPSSSTASSTTTATTKQKLGKTTTTYYFGVLHYLMPSPHQLQRPSYI